MSEQTVSLKAAAIGVIASLAFTLALASGASAAAPAAPGETFITTYLELPEGATAAATSGVADDDIYRSPLSGDGRYVAFASAANALDRAANPDVENIYRKDRTTGEVVLASRATGADSSGPARISSDPRISDDGNLVAFVTDAGLDPSDADGEKDVYVRNISAGTTTLATPNTVEEVDRYDLSADGQYVAFRTADSFTPGDANTTTDIYRRNLGTGATNLVSRTPAVIAASGGGSAGHVSISGDGRWVAFASSSTALARPGFVDNNAGGHDIFARDMQANQTYLVSKRFNVAIPGCQRGQLRTEDRRYSGVVGRREDRLREPCVPTFPTTESATRRSNRASTCGRFRSMLRC